MRENIKWFSVANAVSGFIVAYTFRDTSFLNASALFTIAAAILWQWED